MNITLIGMPGSGKSYIGKILAEKLGYKLIESDSALEHEYEIPIKKVIENLGENFFIEKQAQNIILYTKGQDNLVISPGGSVVYSYDAMKYLKNISTIFYLETDLSTIKERIAKNPRDIVGLEDKTIEQLYEERILLYKKWSSFVINANQDADSVVEDILGHISSSE